MAGVSDDQPPTGGPAGVGDGQSVGDGPPPARTPPALVASAVFGVIGGLVLLAGLVSGQEALAVAGAAGGGLSLGAALLWRSQLIESWHAEQRHTGSAPKHTA